MDVSIVIVSWQVKEPLRRCLASIYAHPSTLATEVFVVDNASTDGTVEMVRESFPMVTIIANEKNLGFAKACNQAIKKSTGEFIYILNPDTEVTDGSISALHDFMHSTNDCGIAGCRLVNEDGSLQSSARRFPDLLSHILILLKLHNFFPHLKPIADYYLSDWPHNHTQPVEQVMGACFMIRREVLKRIGLFDEHFYIWYEEVDLCRRALSAGWKTYFYADATILHQKGKSFSQRNPITLQIIFGRSLLYYFFKHSNLYAYAVLLALYPLSIILACGVWLFGIKKKNKEL